jgi:hypothetical protein
MERRGGGRRRGRREQGERRRHEDRQSENISFFLSQPSEIVILRLLFYHSNRSFLLPFYVPTAVQGIIIIIISMSAVPPSDSLGENNSSSPNSSNTNNEDSNNGSNNNNYYVGSSSLVSSDDSSSSISVPVSRRLGSKFVSNISDRAAALANSNMVTRFGVGTVSKLTPNAVKHYTLNQLNYYGNPLLEKIDQKLDQTMNLVQNVANFYNTTAVNNKAAEDEDSAFHHNNTLVAVSDSSSSAYYQYWERLKASFVASHWYSKVDEILLQNSVVRSFTAKMIRPAEVFYNTITEEFLSNGANQEQFLLHLKQRVGPAWDDRLAPLAKGFYSTARAVSAIVGAGRFVGGALQLGKAKVNDAIDDLLLQWERVLGSADYMMERYLPEIPQRQLLACSADTNNNNNNQLIKVTDSVDLEDSLSLSSDAEYDYSSDEENTVMNDNNLSQSTVVSPSDLSSAPSETSEASSWNAGKKRVYTADNCLMLDDEDESLDPSSHQLILAPADEQPHDIRSGRVLVTKFGKRIKQRIPAIPTMRDVSFNVQNWGEQLKLQLQQSSWFQSVDGILMENPLVKAFANLVQPAEHFFNTSLHLFQTRTMNINININSNATNTSNNNNSTNSTAIAANNSNDNNVQLLSASASSFTAGNNDSNSSNQQPPSPLPSFALPSIDTTNANNISTVHNIDLSTSPVLVDDFLFNLRRALGSSWDDRLLNQAKYFFQQAQAAAQVNNNHNTNNNPLNSPLHSPYLQPQTLA